MDPEKLRADLRVAATHVPAGPDEPRQIVASKVRRRRRRVSLLVTAAVVAVAVAGPVLAGVFDRPARVDFIGPAEPPAEPVTSEHTDAAPGPVDSELIPACAPADIPPRDGGQLVMAYVPCMTDADGGRTVARIYRWVKDTSPAGIVRMTFDCPMIVELTVGRQCLFVGPGQGLVTDVEIADGQARVVLNDAVDGLSGSLRTPHLLFDALDATVFANFDDVDRIEYVLDPEPSGLEPTDDPNALCELVGVADGCTVTLRDDWAAEPDGWQVSPVTEPDAIGTFGGNHPTGPMRIGEVVITTDGYASSKVRAVDATTGKGRWTYVLDSASGGAFVADQAAGDLVLVAPSKGDVTAIDAASGDVQWMWYEKPKDVFPGAPTVLEGVVYLPGSYSLEGDDRAPLLAAVDASSGRIRWQTMLEPDSELQWAPPTVADDLVLVASTPDGQTGAGHLIAVQRATGQISWSFNFPTRGQAFHSVAPLVVDNVAIATDNGVLYGIDLSGGTELWRRPGALIFGVTDDGVRIDAGSGLETIDPTTGTTIGR